jgi:predicted nucleotidyltransferase
MATVTDPWTVLDPDQAAIARRALAEESARRDHLVVYLSGAHAYGFPSPDSDLDLKAIHLAPTEAFLGLGEPEASAGRLEVIDGVEIDYGSNEVAKALGRIVAGDGNFVERVLGELTLAGSDALDTLRPLVERSLSKRLHRHYRGFAFSQAKKAREKKTAKAMLYVLRTTLTGVHVLATGRIVTDLGVLAAEHGVPGVADLIEQKRSAEGAPLADPDRWLARIDTCLERLEAAYRDSPLPEECPNGDELEDWLVALRAERLGRSSASR